MTIYQYPAAPGCTGYVRAATTDKSWAAILAAHHATPTFRSDKTNG